NKAIELNTEYFNKTLDFYKSAWGHYTPEKMKATAKELNDLTQHNVKAVTETTESHMKVLQEAMK
ncbi:MAG: hypothetical protein KDC54_10635, partial [Lewinella sp.]|nr:hypothetical protein [Lewinella sp.]